jgi:mercuric ion transport protein
VIAAFAASSCCVGPFLLVALGVSGGSLAVALSRVAGYRVPLMAIAVTLLGVGFVLRYRQERRTAASNACGCPNSRRHSGRGALWLASAVVVGLAATPSLFARSLDGAQPGKVPSDLLVTSFLRVRGADCEACAVHMRKALERVGGLDRLDLKVAQGEVEIVYVPEPGRLEAYAAAITELGYPATIRAATAPR